MPAERVGKNVVLTGATGFAGRQVHRALLERGHNVQSIIREGTASRLIDGGDSRYRETADLFREPRDWWAEACHGADTLVHAAWFVDPATYLSAPANIDCLCGSLQMVLGALDAGVAHIIGIGTCFEYRLPAADLAVTAPVEPTTLYATSKLALFQTLTALLATAPTVFTWARLFYLYGEGENEKRLVPYLRGCLARNETAKLSIGTQVRDFLDIRIAGDMIASLVATRQAGPVNICSGQPITIRQLAEQIADETGQRDLLEFGTAPLRPTDPPVVTGLCNLEHYSPLRRAS